MDLMTYVSDQGRYFDAPSLAPSGPPRHRAPKHRADVKVDWCRATRSGFPCFDCEWYAAQESTHRAGRIYAARVARTAP